MAGNDPNGRNLAAGMKLLHEEMKGLRGDIAGLRGDIAAALRDAAEDRRRSDRRFEFLAETMREERKSSDARFRTLVRGVVVVGQRILRKLDEHGEILKDIRRGRNGRPGGRNGNGRPKA